MVRLNLACGTDIREGWVNLDVVEKWPTARRRCDVIWDARTDRIPFDDNSAEEIYAGYLLLHLAPRYHKDVLAEIRRVVKPTGVLLVGEVDMEIVMQNYLKDPFNPRYSELIWGEQNPDPSLNEFDKHNQGFTQESLEKELFDNGFNDFVRVKIHSAEVFYELTLVCRKKAYH